MSDVDERLREAAAALRGAGPGSTRDIHARARRRRRRTRSGVAAATAVVIVAGAVAIASFRHDTTRVQIDGPTSTTPSSPTTAQDARSYADVVRPLVGVEGRRAYLVTQRGRQVLYTGSKPLLAAYRSRHGAVVVQQHPFDLVIVPQPGAAPITLPNKRLLGVASMGDDDVAFVETATHQADRPLEIVHLRDGSITPTQIIVPAKKDISRVSMFGDVLVVVHTDAQGGSAVDFRHADGTTVTGFADPAAVVKGGVTSAVASPDGTKMAMTVDDQRVDIIELRSGRILLEAVVSQPSGTTVNDLDYDGRWLMVVRDGTRFVDATPNPPPMLYDTHTATLVSVGIGGARNFATLDQEAMVVTPPPPSTTTTTVSRQALASVPALFVASPGGTITRISRGSTSSLATNLTGDALDQAMGPTYRLLDGRLLATTDPTQCGGLLGVVSRGRVTRIVPHNPVVSPESVLGAGSWHGRSVVIVSQATNVAGCTRVEDFNEYIVSVADGRILGEIPAAKGAQTVGSWTRTLLADMLLQFGSGESVVNYVSLVTPARPLPPAPKISGAAAAVALSPDGRELAVLTTPTQFPTAPVLAWSVAIVDVSSGAVTRTIPIQWDATARPAIAFDGRWLAVGNPALAIQPVRVLDTATPTASWLALPGAGGSPTFDHVMGT